MKSKIIAGWAVVLAQLVLSGVKGTVVRYMWALESSAPIQLLESRGFSKDSFKPGDVIEACGFAPKSAFRSRTETSNQDNTTPGPVWLDGADDRVITARLLLTQDGSKEHWSHYGPLELCVR